MSRKLHMLTAPAFLFLFLFAGCATAPKEEITPSEYISHIKFLASDELSGRGNGTPGLEKAARYISREFRRLGLEPGGDVNYFQYFKIRTGSKLGRDNHLSLMSGSGTVELEVGRDYFPLSFGSEGVEDLPLVFAGYGITATEHDYDDYAGIDVNGKAVLVLALEPQRDRADSVFEGTSDTNHSMTQRKVLNARMHGAAAVVVIKGPLHRRPGEPELPSWRGGFAVQEMGIPGAWALARPFEDYLKGVGVDLLRTQERIDEELKPLSAEIKGLRLSLSADVVTQQHRVANVVGILPGTDPKLKEEVIVVGAHYDHLGLGYVNSMAPDAAGEIHNGADDNASGTSGLLEIAGKLSLSLRGSRRTILFVAFAGEELGLLGSAHFVANPPVPKDKIVAMLNMDMIGRPMNNQLIIGGAGTGAEFRGIIEEVSKRHNFDLSIDIGGISASDHTSFVLRGIPSLFFFSGVHRDYHRPSDDWDKIDTKGGAAIARFAADVLLAIDALDARPSFVEVKQPARPARQQDGDRPWFGSVPDFSYQGDGYRFQSVVPGSPAAEAGLKALDVMVEIGGKEVKNIYDFTAVLGSYQPGDTVEVVVLRDGEKMSVQVTLKRRR